MWCLDILVGLLRLRKCSPETYRPELKGGVSVVRELHVYPFVMYVATITMNGVHITIISFMNVAMQLYQLNDTSVKQCYHLTLIA